MIGNLSLHRCRRRASNDSSHDWTSSREGIRLFSDRLASVVRRRIRFAARDLKSFALESRERCCCSWSSLSKHTWWLLWIFSSSSSPMWKSCCWLLIRERWNRRPRWRRRSVPRSRNELNAAFSSICQNISRSLSRRSSSKQSFTSHNASLVVMMGEVIDIVYCISSSSLGPLYLL